MTVELGSRTRFTATALLLVAGFGCAAQPAPDTGAKTPQQLVRDKADPGDPPAQVVQPARPVQDVASTAHYRAQAIYLSALDLFDQREYDLAYLEFGRALDVDPTLYMAWFKKGLCQFYKQKYDLEIDCYRRCLEIAPDYMPALLNLANAYLAQDQLERGVPIYRKILELDPKHQVALYNLGICYFDLQDYHSAIQFLHKFIELYPTDPSRPKAELLEKRAQQKLDAQR